jgi:hypothetical protein
MSILPRLADNKGIISSALGKSLAKEVLQGDAAILKEAVGLLAYDEKNVRAGAAKIVEQVAVADSSLVVRHLPQLLLALDLPEPQTRWMAIHTLGLCAALDAETAKQALPKAETYIEADSGACLWGATVIYLGFLGATSEQNARAVFPTLERALYRIPGQAKNVLESFLRMLDQADSEIRSATIEHAIRYREDDRPSVRRIARRILTRVEMVWAADQRSRRGLNDFRSLMSPVCKNHSAPATAGETEER